MVADPDPAKVALVDKGLSKSCRSGLNKEKL